MTAARIAGVDEVGRGPLAGPVIACAVVLDRVPEGLADSKALAPTRRRALAAEIRRHGHVALGAASVREIDAMNILEASLLAMTRAVMRLPLVPAEVWVDGNRAPRLALPVRCIVGGDREVPEIMAASIVAKVVRDGLMAKLARRHPDYGFERHAGYPTAAHRRALVLFGPCPHHRRSFAPVRALCRCASQPPRSAVQKASRAAKEAAESVGWRMRKRMARPG